MPEALSRRDELERMRKRLSEAFYSDETKPADLSPLSRRLMEVDRELEAMDAAEAEDDVGRALETPDEELDADSL